MELRGTLFAVCLRYLSVVRHRSSGSRVSAMEEVQSVALIMCH